MVFAPAYTHNFKSIPNIDMWPFTTPQSSQRSLIDLYFSFS